MLSIVDELTERLDRQGSVILTAPPGTGKTTLVPPALAEAQHRTNGSTGRVILVVPRRIAARAAAARMAANNGERAGQRFGYSVRGDRRVSAGTQVEAVTPGLLLRRLQGDPELSGISTVILDEFHERSVDQDLLLALLLDTWDALRTDLRLLIMSATLDVDPLASLVSHPGGVAAPVISVESPLHPVETLWRPGNLHEPLGERVADIVTEALGSTSGDVLVFLPGRSEIGAARRVLAKRIGEGVRLLALHGSIPPAEQDEILSGHGAGARRVILATSIAETSLTVPGVRTVVDAGLRRTVRVDPAKGLPSLDTGVVSLSTAQQRRGRAAREAPGTCFRMWAARDEETRRAHDPPEILSADLAALALSVKAWGADSPDELRWLDPPPDPSLGRALELLAELGALGSDGRLTAHGRTLSRIGFHPRVASMAALARTNGSTEFGADVLAVLENPDTTGSDLLDAVLRKSRRSGGFVRSQRQWAEVIRGLPTGSGDERAQGLAARGTHDDPAVAVADLVLAGYPDRLARRREGRPGVFLLRSGGEIEVKRGETALADSEWIAAIDLDARSGGTGPGRLHLGCAIPPELVGALVDSTDPDDLSLRTVCDWEPTTGRVRTLRTRMLGAIELDTDTRRAVDSEDLLPLVVERVAADGPAVFPSWGELATTRARVAFVRSAGTRAGTEQLPDLGEDHLRATAAHWVPALLGARAEFRKFAPTADQLRAVLTAQMDHQQRRALDDFAPRSWVGPTGREFRLSYGTVDGDPSTVVLSARLQHLLGVDEHPTIGPHHTPVLVELLSPAGRPLQRTTDLPGFWRGTYSQVRAEMRGRYRKHDWPERPWERG